MRAAVLLLCLSLVAFAPPLPAPSPQTSAPPSKPSTRSSARRGARRTRRPLLRSTRPTRRCCRPTWDASLGREAILEFWKAAFAAAPPAAKLTLAEVEAHGDTAHEVGTYQMFAVRRESRRDRQVRRHLEARRRPMEAASRHLEQRRAGRCHVTRVLTRTRYHRFPGGQSHARHHVADGHIRPVGRLAGSACAVRRGPRGHRGHQPAVRGGVGKEGRRRRGRALHRRRPRHAAQRAGRQGSPGHPRHVEGRAADRARAHPPDYAGDVDTRRCRP